MNSRVAIVAGKTEEERGVRDTLERAEREKIKEAWNR